MKNPSYGLLSLAILTGLSMLSISPAKAQFVIEEDEPVAVVEVTRSGHQITRIQAQEAISIPGVFVQKGPSDTVEVLEGWSNSVPLSIAMQQILPGDWNVEKELLSSDILVSWRGGKTWFEVLEDMVLVEGFDAHVNWESKTVTLGDASSLNMAQLSAPQPGEAPVLLEVAQEITMEPAPVIATPVIAEEILLDLAPVEAIEVSAMALEVEPLEVLAVEETPVVAEPTIEEPAALETVAAEVTQVEDEVERKESEAPVAEPVIAPLVEADFVGPMVMTWELDAGKTLRENVEAWAEQAGWNRVIWEGADYIIAAPATFHGEFDHPEGPLAQLISAYDGSDQPLTARLSRRDKVIHVVNRNFVPASVEPMNPQQLAPRLFD